VRRARSCTIFSWLGVTIEPAGNLLVLGLQRAHHLVGADLLRLHRFQVEVDLDLALDAAHQRRLADAADVLQALLDHLVGERGQLAQGPARGLHRHRDDRESRPG
jgi:hypothetical protein